MPHALTWPECRNVRDLGGLPVGPHQKIRTGALIRSDNLDRLTAESVATVRQAGITRIVDVRSEWECQHFPSPFGEDAIWRNSPLADPNAPDVSTADLIDQYAILLDAHPHRMATAVALIADAPPGPVLVHCHAGKDRTGLVVAMALSVAGVSTTDIAADYAVLGASDVPTLVGTTAPASDDLPAELRPPEPATMIATLTALEERHGSVAEYLRSGGCTPAQLVALRRRLI